MDSLEHITDEAESGILDSPKDHLNPDFFTPEKTLQDAFRGFVLRKVGSAQKKYSLYVRNVLFYGGSAGYQWSPTSDVDVSLYVGWDGTPEEYELLQEEFKSKEYPYKDYPVHIFLKPLSQKEPIEVNEAVYDILHNKWISEPQPFPKDFNVEEMFAQELEDAEVLRQTYAHRLDDLLAKIEDYPNWDDAKTQARCIIEDLHYLYTEYKKLREARDAEYVGLREKLLKNGHIDPLERYAPAEINWKYLDKHKILNTMRGAYELVSDHKVPEFFEILNSKNSQV